MKGSFAVLHAPVISYADIDVTVRTRAEAWGGVDLLVVDYIQQVIGFQELESRALQLRRIVQSIHHLSSEVGSAALLLSQLNDQGDVKDSRSIEEEAALCLRIGMWTMERFITRMWRAAGLKDDTPLTPEIREAFKEIFQTHIDMEVKKNRYGENLSGWTFFVVWEGETGRAKNIVEWTTVARTIANQFRGVTTPSSSSSSNNRLGQRKGSKNEEKVDPSALAQSFFKEFPDEEITDETEEFPF